MDTWVFNNEDLRGLMLNSADWKFLSEVADFLEVNFFYILVSENSYNRGARFLLMRPYKCLNLRNRPFHMYYQSMKHSMLTSQP